MSPAVSVFTVSVATNSSFHDIVTASLVVGHSLLSVRWPETLCLTISATQHLVMTSLEQHWRHTLSPSTRTCSALEASRVTALYKCTITYLLTYLLNGQRAKMHCCFTIHVGMFRISVTDDVFYFLVGVFEWVLWFVFLCFSALPFALINDDAGDDDHLSRGDSPAVKPRILSDACILVRIKYFYSFMTFGPC